MRCASAHCARHCRVRVDAARMLMEDEGGRTYADRLAKCWDPKVRILAAPYADPHLFLDETDHDVIEAASDGEIVADGDVHDTSEALA